MVFKTSIIICGPSQSGKSFLCQQFMSDCPVSPDVSRSSSHSFAVGDGLNSCTKVLELRSMGDMAIIDTVGFPDMDAHAVGLNCAVFNLALGITIGKDAYDKAVKNYLGALLADGKKSEASVFAPDLQKVGELAEAWGVMGNVRCVLFVIPCNNRKLFKKDPDAPFMEDFWAMCGGWRILSHNTCGTMALANNHGFKDDGKVRWTIDVAKRFAGQFFFSPNLEYWSYAEGHVDLHAKVHDWVIPGCKEICEGEKLSRVRRLLTLNEFPAVQGLFSEADAASMGDTVKPWCGQTMSYGRRDAQKFVDIE